MDKKNLFLAGFLFLCFNAYCVFGDSLSLVDYKKYSIENYSMEESYELLLDFFKELDGFEIIRIYEVDNTIRFYRDKKNKKIYHLVCYLPQIKVKNKNGYSFQVDISLTEIGHRRFFRVLPDENQFPVMEVSFFYFPEAYLENNTTIQEQVVPFIFAVEKFLVYRNFDFISKEIE